MKRLIPIYLLLIPVLAFCQVQEYSAKKIRAIDSVFVNGRWVRKITTDLNTADSNSHNMLPTNRAVMDMIRTGGGGGGGDTVGLQGVLAKSRTLSGKDSIIQAGFDFKFKGGQLKPDSVNIGVTQVPAADTTVWIGVSTYSGVGASDDAHSTPYLVARGLNTAALVIGNPGQVLQKPPGLPIASFMDVYTTLIPIKTPGKKYLFFGYGVNDPWVSFTNPSYGMDTGQYRRDFKTVYNFMKSQGWDSTNVLITSPDYQTTDRCPLDTALKYNVMIRSFCDSARLRYIDIFTPGRIDSLIGLADATHPNDYGYQRNANVVLQAIKDLDVVEKDTQVLAVNAMTHVRTLRVENKDTASNTANLLGIEADGKLTVFPQWKYPFFVSKKPAATLIPKGNLYTGGVIQGNLIQSVQSLMAMSNGMPTTGAGAFILYQSGNMILIPRNIDASITGRIHTATGAQVGINNTSITPPIGSNYIFDVNGQTIIKGGLALTDLPIRPAASTNCLLLGYQNNMGVMVARNNTTFFPLGLNWESTTAPVLINKLSDNGIDGLQVKGMGNFSIGAYIADSSHFERRLYVGGSIGANADSIPVVGSITTERTLLIDPATGQFKSTTTAAGPTIYTGDGTLSANRQVLGNNKRLELGTPADHIARLDANTDSIFLSSSTGPIYLSGARVYDIQSYNGTANVAITNSTVELAILSTPRTVNFTSMASAANYRYVVEIINKNNTTNLYTFTTTVIDQYGNTVTDVPNEAVLQLYFNGTNWILKSVSNPAIFTSNAASLTLVAMNADYYFTGTTTTWTLPAVANNKGRTYVIKNMGSGNITLNANGGTNDIYDTGATNTVSITPGQQRTIKHNGTFWTINP